MPAPGASLKGVQAYLGRWGLAQPQPTRYTSCSSSRYTVQTGETRTSDPAALLSWISQQIAWPFRHDNELFLVLVIIGCPLCMNAVQLWIQDAFLRMKEWSAIPVSGAGGAFAAIGSRRNYVASG